MHIGLDTPDLAESILQGYKEGYLSRERHMPYCLISAWEGASCPGQAEADIIH